MWFSTCPILAIPDRHIAGLHTAASIHNLRRHRDPSLPRIFCQTVGRQKFKIAGLIVLDFWM
jgi:hypothetical protein